jgi:ubiquinone biosynthesis protein UbiJ
MAEYRTPLPTILAMMLEAAINRLLALDESSAGRMSRLENRLLQLDLEGLGISLYFTFTSQLVRVRLDSEIEPDTVVSGSPVALFTLAVLDDGDDWGTPGSRVKISGDATLARDLERLFSRLDPDWEAAVSRLFGDVLGHQLASGIQAVSGQLRESTETASEILGEYLRRESGPLVTRQDVSVFADAVDEARDAVERLEARLNSLEDRDASDQSQENTDT